MKPHVTKLALASPSDIGGEHLNWVLNEVGAYKLHSTSCSEGASDWVCNNWPEQEIYHDSRDNYPQL